MIWFVRVFWGVLCCLSTLSNRAEGRWESVSQAQVTYERYETTINIDRDGSYEKTEHYIYRINKESAISLYGMEEIDFESSIEDAKVIDAFVTNGKKRTRVNKKYIQYRAPVSSSTGLDSRKTLIIAFPDVKVGSVIEYKVMIKRRKALLANHYEMLLSVGYFHTRPGKILHIQSAIPLQHHLQGPTDYLNFKHGRKGSLYTYDVDLKREIFLRATDESPHDSWSPEPHRPRVKFSSFNSWAEVTQILSSNMKKSNQKKLPQRFMNFVENAQKKQGFIDQANELMIQMIKELRYMGDWRLAENFNFPRSLDEIDQTSFGDCKDFSLLLSSMIRILGYRADVALIERGARSFSPMVLPGTNYFDHMIVRAVDSTGKVYWLDPTNSAANAGGKWPDIAGRPVLPVFEGAEALENTPPLEPKEYALEFEVEQTLGPGEWRNVKLLARVRGSAAAEVLGNVRSQGPAKVKESFLEIVTEGKLSRNEESSLHTEDEYVPNSLEISVKADVKTHPVLTTAGLAHHLSLPLQKYLHFDTSKMVLGAEINNIESAKIRRFLKGIEVIGALPKDCEIKSRWVEASIKYSKVPEGVIIETTEMVKQIYFTNAELKSAEFEALREQIRSCTNPSVLIYKPILNKHGS